MLVADRFEIVKSTAVETLRSTPFTANPIGVCRASRQIRGYVVAEAGPFRTGRGEFDQASLAAIVRLMNAAPNGTPVLYGHHSDAGAAETLDAFIGVATNARIDRDRVRADLSLSAVAFLNDAGGTSKGERLLLRAESAPQSFGSSLVLQADRQYRLDSRGHRRADQPPIWRPTAIAGSDIVACGDATRGGFLSSSEAIEDWVLRARWRNQKRKAGLI